MEPIYFIKSVFPIVFAEFVAAIAGIYYLRKTSATGYNKYLVAFLCIIVLVEISGWYAPLAYFSDYSYFSFVKDTVFRNNYWIFNIVIIASAVFYILYFRSFIKDENWKKVLKILMYLYVISAVIFLIMTDIYFVGYSQFSTISGTLLIFFSVVIFYLQLLKSDILLNLKFFLPLYISIGVLIFHLCITPIDIFSEYFIKEEKIFVNLKVNVAKYANIFMYSTFAIGFLICSRKKISS